MPLGITHEPPYVLHHFRHQPIFNKITHSTFPMQQKFKNTIMHEEHSSLYAFQITVILSSFTNKTKLWNT
jgi:hypothetical protein